jgi:hypothetical protein
MTRKALMLFATVALMVVAASAVATASTSGETRTETHIKAQLRPVDDSGVQGTVHLFQLPSGGTQIVVLAKGLTAVLIRVDPAANSRRGRTNLRHLRS